jgi:hypothetical protein
MIALHHLRLDPKERRRIHRVLNPTTRLSGALVFIPDLFLDPKIEHLIGGGRRD